MRETIAHNCQLRVWIALFGMDELGTEDLRAVTRARRLKRFLTQPFSVTDALIGTAGRSVPLGLPHDPRWRDV